MREFYRDFRVPEVEKLAKAAARAHGYADDAVVPETGYDNSRAVPAWWKFQSDALTYIAMRNADLGDSEK